MEIIERKLNLIITIDCSSKTNTDCLEKLIEEVESDVVCFLAIDYEDVSIDITNICKPKITINADWDGDDEDTLVDLNENLLKNLIPVMQERISGILVISEDCISINGLFSK